MPPLESLGTGPSVLHWHALLRGAGARDWGASTRRPPLWTRGCSAQRRREELLSPHRFPEGSLRVYPAYCLPWSPVLRGCHGEPRRVHEKQRDARVTQVADILREIPRVGRQTALYLSKGIRLALAVAVFCTFADVPSCSLVPLTSSSPLSQTRYLRPAALNKTRQNVGEDLNDWDVLARLRQFLQASSALSFAARAQEYTDEDLLQLHVRGEDYVRWLA